MLVFGILGGLGAASFQTLGYVALRSYLAAGGTPGAMWARSQIWMLAAGIPLALLLWRSPAAGWPALLFPLATTVGGYLGAQWLLFSALRGVPASRLAPLLGMKIPFLAVLALMLDQTTIGAWRWTAVGMAAVAAIAIQFSGIRLRAWQFLAVIGCAAGYAISDVSVVFLTEGIAFADPAAADGERPDIGVIMWGLGLVYTVCGVVVAPLLPRATRADDRGWLTCLPYAVAWLAAMGSLFCAIAWLGVVPAVILQALRGPLSVIVGQMVARRGHHHLETPLDWRGALRQILAASLMVAATALWVWAGG